MNNKDKIILLVEDNEGDIVLITDAFEEASIAVTLKIVRNGQDALSFLMKKNGYENEPRPDLIILDVNLPRLNGHEVLKVIKEDEDLRRIPVVMLTTSSSPSDINRSYQNHVNCYITKPVDVDDFMKAVVSIESFWINIVELPS